MPRLTNADYLHQRNELRRDWFNHRAWAFGSIEPAEQMALHAFFAPTKDLTDHQAIEYRQQVTAKNASLPHRAGRAFAQARQHFGHAPAPRPVLPLPKPKPVRGGTITVRVIVRPEPDIAQLIQALKMLQEQDEKNKKNVA